MKKYLVRAKITSYAVLEVEAESKDEALEYAENVDGGDFTPETDGDFELLYAFEKGH